MRVRFLVSECMPVIDALKTAGVLGLLMQQAAAFPVMHENNGYDKHHTYCSNSASAQEKLPDEVEDALSYLQENTRIIKKFYSLIANSEREVALETIKALEGVKTVLIEQQVRGLEGALRMSYQAASEQRKHILKPVLIVVAEARAALSELNNLFAQMTKPVDVFMSNTDRHALKALADHGTQVFISGRFH